VVPEKTSVARQQLGKHVPAAVDTHTTIEELLKPLSTEPAKGISTVTSRYQGKTSEDIADSAL
jgi:hypothetical protein